MPSIVKDFETTPNPNALKCNLGRAIADRPRSYLNSEALPEAGPNSDALDDLARSIFELGGVRCLLFNTDWVTINKDADADWKSLKASVRSLLNSSDSLPTP